MFNNGSYEGCIYCYNFHDNLTSGGYQGKYQNQIRTLWTVWRTTSTLQINVIINHRALYYYLGTCLDVEVRWVDIIS